MFKFKLGRKHSDDNEIQSRTQRNTFKLQKFCDRGFPSRPSAIAYDSHLKLIAIGTQLGEIRIYGQADFQISTSLDRTSHIRQMIFLPGQTRLVVLTVDGYLHFFQINNGPRLRLHCLFTSNEDQQTILGQIQTCSLLRDHLHLIIGLKNGNIHRFHLEKYTLEPLITSEQIENIVSNYSADSSIQSIIQHPIDDEKLLVALKTKLILHWNLSSNTHERLYLTTQEIESACWYNQGKNFACSHSNGSYTLWNSEQEPSVVPTEKIPYGPYPCTPMTKIVVKSQRNGDPLIIFTGGLPRSSYANKHTVSCLDEKEYQIDRTRHVTFDFTSSVVDFFTIDQDQSELSIREDPHSLVVLLHEELVMIDLLTDHWPTFHLPYLTSIHASPVICTTVVCHVQEEFYKKLCHFGSLQVEEYSDRPWPITGGEKVANENSSTERHLLLTGHEDGSVKFWDVTHVSMPLIYQMKTSDYFQVEQAPEEEADDESWPPFRKTGVFDPYCDDPRLAIQKLALCTNTETLIVAGTAGQILTFQLTSTPTEIHLDTVTVNLLENHQNFVWKGHEELKTKSTNVLAGFIVTSFAQLYPPAAVSALALCSDLQLYSIGTAHGFALFNYQHQRILLAQSTLDPNATVTASATPLSVGQATLNRGRSLKKSLRESFRRLRKGRTIKKATMIDRIDEDQPYTPNENQTSEIIRVPVERQVEFRDLKPVQDHVLTMVRCLYFAQTYLNSVHDRTHSLWVGTNGGHVYVYSINNIQIPSNNDMNSIVSDPSVKCSLAKEIRLKHKAPVLSIAVLNGSNQLIGQGSNIPAIDKKRPIPILPMLSNSDYTTSVSTTSLHRVLICSEEQFKIFTLPNLKPFCKFKLTATEGSRVRKVTIYQPSITSNSTGTLLISSSTPKCLSSFSINSDQTNESFLICLDNIGELGIYSLPLLRRQNLFHCIKPSDINAISSLQFTCYARAFYLQSSSEFSEIIYSGQTGQQSSMVIIPERHAEKQTETPVVEIESNHQIEEPMNNNVSVVITENDSMHEKKLSLSSQIEETLNNETLVDSAIKPNLTKSSGDDTNAKQQPMADIEVQPTTEKVRDLSPARHKKGPAPHPPSPSPKQIRAKSAKTRPAPIINEQFQINGDQQ